MFGLDLRSTTKAAYLNPLKVRPSTVKGLQGESYVVTIISLRLGCGSHKEIAESLQTQV